MTHSDQGPPTSALIATLERDQARILHDWEQGARRVAAAAKLPRPQLLDHLPRFLEELAGALRDALVGDDPRSADHVAHQHALTRLEEGFDLSEVIQELSILRDVILVHHAAGGAHGPQDGGGPQDGEQLRILHQTFDRAIGASAVRFTHTRDRALRVLDRISATALEASDLDELLGQIAAAFREEVPVADSVAIYLRQGDELQLRAALGLEDDQREGLQLRLGEGFTGSVAEEGRPLELRAAASDPLVKSPTLRRLGIKALYGVPLIADGEVVGVAHMGSLTADSFSQQDKVLFGSMAARATAGIRLHALQEVAQRRAEALELSERRYRATFENAAVGMAHVGFDGSWQRLNQRYCEFLGYSEEELRQLRYQDLTHPDDLSAEQVEIERLREGQTSSYALDKRHVRKDGQVLWVRASVAQVRQDGSSHLVVAAQDTSAQIRLRDRLTFLSRASLALASTLDLERVAGEVAALAVPFLADACLLQLDRVDDAARGIEVLAWGQPPQLSLLRGQPTPAQAAPAPPARHASHAHLVRGLGVGDWVSVPLQSGSETLGALSLALLPGRRGWDQEDQDLAQELARRAAVALDNARLHEESQQSALLRERILAIVSHDLRDPLGTIDLANSLLLRSQVVREDLRARRQIEVIHRGTQRAVRLVNDLLDVASIQAGKLSLDLAPCPLGPVFEEAVEAYEPLAREKGVGLRWERVGEEVWVCGDADRLRQVLSNLLGNALRFCRNGDAIVVRAEVTGEMARLAVSDTGPGIDPAEQERIFDLYWKSRRPEGGTGLGLFISRGIVESHGGRITVHSQPGAGATFTFTLPLAEPPPPADRRSE